MCGIYWEQSAIEVSKDSLKDELCLIVFVLIITANFVLSLKDNAAQGFADLETTRPLGSVGMCASIAASFGNEQ